MKRHSSPFIKGVVCFVVLAFLTTSTAGAIPQNLSEIRHGVSSKSPASASCANDGTSLVIPEAYGSIGEKVASPIPGKKDKWILEIQDSHANFEAQNNIRNILDFLNRPGAGAKLDLVGLEGAKGDVDVSFMRKAPDEAAKLAVTERFLKAAYFTGTEAYAIASKSQPPRIFGLEEKDLYFDHLDAFRKACQASEAAQSGVTQIKTALDDLKNNLFSGDALEFLNRSEAFALDNATLTDYLHYLQGMAVRTAEDLAQYPQLQKIWKSLELEQATDQAKVDVEKKALIETLQKQLVKEDLAALVQKSILYRTGRISAWDFYGYLRALAKQKGIAWVQYPNLDRYIGTVEIYADFRMDILFVEIEKLEDVFRKKLYQNTDQSELDQKMKNWRTMQSLLELKLNRRNLAYYQKHKDEISPAAFVAYINKPKTKRDALTGAVGLSQDIGSIDVAQANRFYDLALKRDLALVTNALKNMDNPSVKTVAMVTGGFHSEGIKEIIRQKGYSYAVITPRISKADDGSLYRSIMLDERHGFEKLLDRQGNRLAPLVRSPNGLLNEEQKRDVDILFLAALVEKVFQERLAKYAPEDLRKALEAKMRQRYGEGISIQLGTQGPGEMLPVMVRYEGDSKEFRVARAGIVTDLGVKQWPQKQAEKVPSSSAPTAPVAQAQPAKKIMGTGTQSATEVQQVDVIMIKNESGKFKKTLENWQVNPGSEGVIQILDENGTVMMTLRRVASEDMGQNEDLANPVFDEKGEIKEIVIAEKLFEEILALMQRSEKDGQAIVKELVFHEYVENVIIPKKRKLLPSDKRHALTSRIEREIYGTTISALNRLIIGSPELMTNEQLLAIQYNHPNDPNHEFYFATRLELIKRHAYSIEDQIRCPDKRIALAAINELGENSERGIIKALIKFASAHEDREINDAAKKALQRIGKPAVARLISVLTGYLEHGYSNEAIAIMKVLASIRDERAAPIFIRLAGHPDNTYRNEAIIALSGFKENADARKAVLMSLYDLDGGVRAAVDAALASFGQSVVPTLLTRLRNSDAYSRMRIIKILASIGGKTVWDALVGFLFDENPRVRIAIENEMKNVNMGMSALLLPYLSHGDERVRDSVCEVLANGRDPEGKAALMSASGDEDPTVRSAAAVGLAKMHTQDAHNRLMDMIKDPVYKVRLAAIEALGKNSEYDSFDILSKIIEEENEVKPLRIAAVKSLGKLKDPRVDAKLKALLLDESGEVSIAIIQEIGSRKHKEFSDDLIIAFMTTDHIDKRCAVIEALGEIGGDGSYAFIENIVATKGAGYGGAVYISAIKALGGFKNDRAFELLERMMREGNQDECDAASLALARHGDERAIKLLFDKAMSSEDNREYAADAARKGLDQLDFARLLLYIKKNYGMPMIAAALTLVDEKFNAKSAYLVSQPFFQMGLFKFMRGSKHREALLEIATKDLIEGDLEAKVLAAIILLRTGTERAAIRPLISVLLNIKRGNPATRERVLFDGSASLLTALISDPVGRREHYAIILDALLGEENIALDDLDRLERLVANLLKRVQEIGGGTLDPMIIYTIYKNESFSLNTNNLGSANQYSVARAIDLALKRYGMPPTDANIEKVLPIVLRLRGQYTTRIVLGKGKRLIIACHQEERFDPTPISNFAKTLGVEEIDIAAFKGKETKDKFLEELAKESTGKATLWFNGHGGPNHFWFASGEIGKERSDALHDPRALSWQEFADALIACAEKNGGDLSEMTIMIDACYSANFIVRTLNHLHSKGVKKLPMIVAATNRGVLGWGDVMSRSIQNAAKEKTELTMAEIYVAEEEASHDEDFAYFLPLEAGELQNLRSTLLSKEEAVPKPSLVSTQNIPALPVQTEASQPALPDRAATEAVLASPAIAYGMPDIGILGEGTTRLYGDLAPDMPVLDAFKVPGQAKADKTGETAETIDRANIEKIASEVEGKIGNVTIAKGKVTVEIDGIVIPIEVGTTPDTDFANGVMENGRLVRIVVSRALFDKIHSSKDPPRAFRILARHEYIENVLGKSHAFTSAVDAYLERTTLHALAEAVMSSMTTNQLLAIRYKHPNDERYEYAFYHGVTTELLRRAQEVIAEGKSEEALKIYLGVVAGMEGDAKILTILNIFLERGEKPEIEQINHTLAISLSSKKPDFRELYRDLEKIGTETKLLPVQQGTVDLLSINSVLENPDFSPENLIETLKRTPLLKELYELDAGVSEGYSIEEHTLMVMKQFEKYFPDVGEELPGNVNRRFFRLLLALHDIGKGWALQKGEKDKQHKYTIRFIQTLASHLRFTESETQLAAAIIGGDPLGTYFRTAHLPNALDIATSSLQAMHASSGLSLAEFFNLLTIYYQVDAGSYTRDAGGLASLEFLFKTDPNTGRFERESANEGVKFSTRIAQRYERLKEALLATAETSSTQSVGVSKRPEWMMRILELKKMAREGKQPLSYGYHGTSLYALKGMAEANKRGAGGYRLLSRTRAEELGVPILSGEGTRQGGLLAEDISVTFNYAAARSYAEKFSKIEDPNAFELSHLKDIGAQLKNFLYDFYESQEPSTEAKIKVEDILGENSVFGKPPTKVIALVYREFLNIRNRIAYLEDISREELENDKKLLEIPLVFGLSKSVFSRADSRPMPRWDERSIHQYIDLTEVDHVYTAGENIAEVKQMLGRMGLDGISVLPFESLDLMYFSDQQEAISLAAAMQKKLGHDSKTDTQMLADLHDPFLEYGSVNLAHWEIQGKVRFDISHRSKTEETTSSLIKVMREKDSVGLSAVQRLGQIGDKSTVESLLEFLKELKVGDGYRMLSSEDEQRVLQYQVMIRAVLAALKSLESPEAFAEQLMALVNNPDYAHARLEIIESLGDMKSEKVIDVIRAIMEEADGWREKNVATKALQRISLRLGSKKIVGADMADSPRAIQPLIDALKATDRKIQFAAIRGLADLDANTEEGKRAIEPLLAVVRESEPRLRAAALHALADLKYPKISSLLLEDFNSGLSSPEELMYRREFLYKFVQFGRTLMISSDEREKLIDDCARIPDFSPIILALGQSETAVRLSALKGFNFSPRTAEIILTIGSGGVSSRDSAQAELNTLEDAGIVDSLLIILRNEREYWPRKYAIRALGAIKDARAVDQLIELSKDEDSYIRRHAIESLGSFKDERVVKVLVTHAQDVSMYMRNYAMQSLAKIGGKGAMDAFALLLDNADIRNEVLRELLKSRDPNVVVPMRKAVAMGGEQFPQTRENLYEKIQKELYKIEPQALQGVPALKIPGAAKVDRTGQTAETIDRSDVANVAEEAESKIGDVTIADGEVTVVVDGNIIPIEVGVTPNTDFANGIVESGRLIRIVVSQVLFEKIRSSKDPPRAFRILARHEFVENVLGKSHAFTSAVDAYLEKTTMHALMEVTLQAMTVDQLRAIQPGHPNDPDNTVYVTARKALQGDVGESAVKFFAQLLSRTPQGRVKVLQSLASSLPGEGNDKEEQLQQLNLKDPLIARELLYQLLEQIGAEITAVDPATGQIVSSREFQFEDISARELLFGINSAFSTQLLKVRFLEMAKYYAARRDTRRLADRLQLDEARDQDAQEAIAKRILGKDKLADLSDAERKVIGEDLPFLALLSQAYLSAEETKRTGKSEPMLRLDAGILAGKTEAEQAVYLSLLERLAVGGMNVSVENFADQMEEGLAKRLATLEEKNQNVSFMPKREGRNGQAMMAAARARLLARRPGAKVPNTYVGHFLQSTLHEYFTHAELAAFSVLLVQKADGGLVELNGINRAIAEQLGVKTVDGTLELLPEITKDRQFINTLEEAYRTTSFQA